MPVALIMRQPVKSAWESPAAVLADEVPLAEVPAAELLLAELPHAVMARAAAAARPATAACRRRPRRGEEDVLVLAITGGLTSMKAEAESYFVMRITEQGRRAAGPPQVFGHQNFP